MRHSCQLLECVIVFTTFYLMSFLFQFPSSMRQSSVSISTGECKTHFLGLLTSSVTLSITYYCRWYSSTSYFLSLVLSDFPVIMLSTGLFTIISYVMTRQPLEMFRFVNFILISVLSSFCAQAHGILFGALFDLKVWICSLFCVSRVAYHAFIFCCFAGCADCSCPLGEWLISVLQLCSALIATFFSIIHRRVVTLWVRI